MWAVGEKLDALARKKIIHFGEWYQINNFYLLHTIHNRIQFAQLFSLSQASNFQPTSCHVLKFRTRLLYYSIVFAKMVPKNNFYFIYYYSVVSLCNGHMFFFKRNRYIIWINVKNMYKYIFDYCFLLYFLPRYLAKLLQNSSFREQEIVRAVPSASSCTFPSALITCFRFTI